MINRLLAPFGCRLVRLQPPVDPLASVPDLPVEDRETLRRAQPFTLTGPERLASLVNAVHHVVRHRVPGDIAECGVWRGGSMMAVALTLLRLGDTSRRLYLYDTFEGMPPPTAKDVDVDGHTAAALLQRDAVRTGVWAYADLADVKRNLLSTGYPADQIIFVPGKVEETIPATKAPELALLRLDTDWYESTRHEFHHLYPTLRSQGILIVDDYGHWRGAREATDEFLGTLPHPLFLHRVDYTARLAVKP